MILDVADQIIELCEREVERDKEDKRERIAQGEQLTTAQKSKAVLVTFRGVSNINAETVLSRHRDLRILHDYLIQLPDPYQWELPIENIRPTLNWSGRWGVKDDAMLLVGAFLYGFGNWEVIQKEPKLGLEGKFFLDEGKKTEEKEEKPGDSSSKPIPNAIHLVRRGDFLLNLLREYNEKMLSYQESLRRPVKQSVSMSPPPQQQISHISSSHSVNGIKRRAESEAVASVEEGSSKMRKRRSTPTFTDSESSDDWYVSFPSVVVATVAQCYS